MPEPADEQERQPRPGRRFERSSDQRGEPEADRAETNAWDRYWDRFRRQEVDDRVDERHREQGGYFERFRRQQVDDPVGRRGERRSS